MRKRISSMDSSYCEAIECKLNPIRRVTRFYFTLSLPLEDLRVNQQKRANHSIVVNVEMEKDISRL